MRETPLMVLAVFVGNLAFFLLVVWLGGLLGSGLLRVLKGKCSLGLAMAAAVTVAIAVVMLLTTPEWLAYDAWTHKASLEYRWLRGAEFWGRLAGMGAGIAVGSSLWRSASAPKNEPKHIETPSAHS